MDEKKHILLHNPTLKFTMQGSGLLVMLSTFSPGEIKEFGEYLNSSFFNTNENIVKLYDHLRKYHPGFENKKLEKQYIFSKIFGKAEYNDGYMRTMMFNLQQLAEGYLSYINYSRSEKTRAIHLISELTDKGLQKQLEKKFKEIDKTLIDEEAMDPYEYYFRFNYEFNRNYHYSINFTLKKGGEPDERIYKEQEYLIGYFLLRLLANHFYHLNQSLIINYHPKLQFLDEIVEFLKKNPRYLENPLINLSFHKVLLLKELNDECFYKLKEVFYKEVESLNTADRYNTLSILINYCQRAYINCGTTDYLIEKLEVLKFALDNKIHSFREDDHFSEGKFKNIVSTAASIREFEWVEDFIDKYEKLLDPEIRNDVVSMCRAHVAFEKGEFENALKQLNIIQVLNDVNSKMNLKLLYLMIFYELNWTEQALSLSDSFRHLIAKDTLMPEIPKEALKNFLSRYNRLLKLKLNFDKDKYDLLINELQRTGNTSNRNWLLKKALELAGND